MTRSDEILTTLDGFDAARFWTKVAIRDDDCWEWQGSLNRDGYGVFGAHGQMLRAPRVAYALAYGEPPHLLVCHTCDNRECVNPRHLFTGTQQDNIDDAKRKGRALGTRARVITDKQVAEIKDLLQTGAVSQREIARRFNVSPSLITHIKKGRVHV